MQARASRDSTTRGQFSHQACRMWSGQPQSCPAVFGGPQPQRRDALWLIFYFSISLSLSLISASLISLLQGLLQNGRRRALNQKADLLVIIRLLGETLEGIWSTTKKRADMFFSYGSTQLNGYQKNAVAYFLQPN